MEHCNDKNILLDFVIEMVILPKGTIVIFYSEFIVILEVYNQFYEMRMLTMKYTICKVAVIMFWSVWLRYD